MSFEPGPLPESVGYSGPAYPHTLGHIGRPRGLVAAGGWCLIRTIPGTPWHDAVGPYPFLTCRKWSMLAEDLPRLAAEAITATFVTDPLADASSELLSRIFPDLCRHYKEHVVVDLAGCPSRDWSPHHSRNVARGLRETDVAFLDQPLSKLDDWTDLYELLIRRHGISGPATFSAASFRLQFSLRGLLVARAARRDETLGMTMWFIDGDRAYYHLGAVTDRGRQFRAMFAMFAIAFEELRRRGVSRLCLGAGAGTHTASAGLERFKLGWANRTLPVYLCGRVLDHRAYDSACRISGVNPSQSFFPPYRRP